LKYDTRGIDPSLELMEGENWSRNLMAQEFDPSTMSPIAKEEFDKTQGILREIAHYHQTISSERRSDMRQARMVEEMGLIRSTNPSSTSDELTRLREENRKLHEDKAYWIARTNVLASILEKNKSVNPEDLKLERKVHTEFLTKMVKEEMIIRVRNDANRLKDINDPNVKWNSPGDVVSVIQKVYGNLFPGVMGKPLDPDGQEPYWQMYMKLIAGQSEKDQKWVENRIEKHVEVKKELNKRSEIRKSMLERTKFYLESVYYDVDSGSQSKIERILPTIQQDFAKVDWLRLEEGSGDLIRPFLADNMRISPKSIQDEYARTNAIAWNASAELYLSKLDEVAKGENGLTVLCRI